MSELIILTVLPTIQFLGTTHDPFPEIHNEYQHITPLREPVIKSLALELSPKTTKTDD